MKKLGFGLMRMPTLDPNDPSKVDIEQVKQMVDLFMANGFTYFGTAWIVSSAATVTAVVRSPSIRASGCRRSEHLWRPDKTNDANTRRFRL